MCVKRKMLYSVIKVQGRIEGKGKRREWSERGQCVSVGCQVVLEGLFWRAKFFVETT